jgi:hypothetical protein
LVPAASRRVRVAPSPLSAASYSCKDSCSLLGSVG